MVHPSDRWDRTQRRLLRNFLVNPGFPLEPIPEEEDSSGSAGSDGGSLPDLVIEREPDRHDESEDFYAGLERRMRRFYRQLFFGENDSENEDSLEFEVNRSMTSTYIMDEADAKFESKNAAAEDRSCDEIINGKKLTHVTDNNNRTNDDDNDSYQIDSDTNIAHSTDHCKENVEDAGKKCVLIDTPSDEVVRKSTEIVSETNKSTDTDDSVPCHRISTTVVEIHEPWPLTTPTRLSIDRSGSPVLIPRFQRRRRYVVESDSDIYEKETEDVESETEDKEEEADGEEEAEDGEEHTDSTEEETILQRVLTDSEITNMTRHSSTSPHSDPPAAEESFGAAFNYKAQNSSNVNDVDESKNIRKAHSSTKCLFLSDTDEEMEGSDNLEPVEEMRGPREACGRASFICMNDARGIESAAAENGAALLEFETETSADKLAEASEEINAQEVEMESESTESLNSPLSTTAISAIHDFWSASPTRVDIEESPSNNLRLGSKRRSESEEESTSKKKRTNVTWEDIKADMFVGTPLVFQLCQCQDHVCPKKAA